MKNVFLYYFDIIGLFLNFSGTLFIIYYMDVDKKEYVCGEETGGKKWYSVVIKYPSFIKIGLVLIFLGFIFSCVDIFLNIK